MTNPTPDLDLRKFGYAPGRYMGKCLSCGEEQWDLDKRSTSCRPCAIKRYEQSLTEPPTSDIDRAISEAVEARWLPIESAPKDGTAILLFGRCIGEIAGDLDEGNVMAVGSSLGGCFYLHSTDYYSVEVDASHWMPLPAPPAAIRKDQS